MIEVVLSFLADVHTWQNFRRRTYGRSAAQTKKIEVFRKKTPIPYSAQEIGNMTDGAV